MSGNLERPEETIDVEALGTTGTGVAETKHQGTNPNTSSPRSQSEDSQNNLFDCLVDVTITTLDPKMEARQRLVTANGSHRRRRPRQLRVKRYATNGDEVTPDTTDTLPTAENQSQDSYAATPSKMSSSNYRVQHPLSPKSRTNSISSTGSTSVGRIKHYPIMVDRPPTIVSSASEDDDDESDERLASIDDAAGSFPSAPTSRTVSKDSMDTTFTSQGDDTYVHFQDTSSESPSRILRELGEGNGDSQVNAMDNSNDVVTLRQQTNEGSHPDPVPSNYYYSTQNKRLPDPMEDDTTSSHEEGDYPSILNVNPASTRTSEFPLVNRDDNKLSDINLDIEAQQQRPAQNNAVAMASLAGAVAAKRKQQQEVEEVVEGTPKDEMQTEAPIISSSDRDLEAPALTTKEKIELRRQEQQQHRVAAAAIAAAAISQKGNLTRREPPPEKKQKPEAADPQRMIELRSTPSKTLSVRFDGDEESPRRMVELKSPEQREEDRRTRRLELERKKRELEAIARSSGQNYSRGNTSSEISRSRSNSGDSFHTPRQRTVNIDVYTGEVIGEMPKARYSTRSDNDSDSDSEFTETSYDVPVSSKAKLVVPLLLFLLVAGGLGVYFGLFFGKDENQSSINPVNNDLLGESATTPGTAASEGLQTMSPTTNETVSPKNLSLPLLDGNISASLMELLLDEWPELSETIGDDSSPQRQALEWLTQDVMNRVYGTERTKQRYGLAVLFYSTNGDGWTNSTGWLTESHECTWYSSSSVRPQCEKAMYVNLELNMNGLSGSLPPEIGMLTFLRRIDASRIEGDRTISGHLPSQIGLLTNVEILKLHGNQLSGSIPWQIAGLTALSVLDIRSNSLSGQIPTEFGLLRPLSELYLENNLFGGTIPTEIGGLTSLKTVSLNDNKVGGAIPTEIGDMQLLEHFYAANNHFSFLPDEIAQVPNLLTLSLSNNQLSGSISEQLGALSTLLSLDLSGNILNGTIPSTIGGLSTIRDRLDLSANRLTGTIPTEVGVLTSLRGLYLQNNFLTGNVPDSFQFLDNLNMIRLEGNDMMGSVPTVVCEVFDNSLPTFTSDCPVLDCECCTHCCSEEEGCKCQYEDDPGLSFLCQGL
eukprot:Nitzschia sp. Nitz4//NODE_628_length_8375_cov_72.089904//4133//7517//NITZ4_additional_000094-RA//-1//CDS//3329532015//4881//frame0